MQEDRVRVSVIVPNYNHEEFLEERLESIFSQTWNDYEVILLDDASTDGSPEILRQHSGHPKVTAVEMNRANSGSPFRQWQRGIELARGELIWIAESDDTADPTFLERMVGMIDAGADLACCRPQKIDEKGKLFTDEIWADSLDPSRWRNDFENDGKAEIRDYLCYRCTIPNASACLFRKREGLFPDAVLESRYAGDWIFWVNYLSAGRFAFTADRLSFHRTHEGTTRSRRDFDGKYGRLLERLTAIRMGRSLTGKGWIRPSEVWKYRYMIRMIRWLKSHPEKNQPVFRVVPFELMFYTGLIELREWVQNSQSSFKKASVSKQEHSEPGANRARSESEPANSSESSVTTTLNGDATDTQATGEPRPLRLLIHTGKTTWEGFTVGGAETSLQLLSEKLAEQGHKVVYLTETPRGRLPRYRVYTRNGVEVHAIGYPDVPSLGFQPLLNLRQRLAEWMFDRAVERIVRKHLIDAIHTYHELPAMHRMLELRKRKGLRFATVLRMAGLFWVSRLEEEPELKEYYEQVFNGVDCLNPISEGILALSREAFDRFGLQVRSDRPVRVQDIGVDLSRLPKNWSSQSQPSKENPVLQIDSNLSGSENTIADNSSARYRLVMASRLSIRQKRQDLLIEAMALLPPDLDAELLLVGDGPARSGLDKTIREKKLDDRVRVIPFMEQQQLWDLIRHCDLYTHACDFEGLSKMIVEVMAMGVPVLASDVTPLDEYIIDGENGFLVENSPQHWADRIAMLLERDGLRSSVSAPARETIHNRFDANRNVLRYEEMFRQITSSRILS